MLSRFGSVMEYRILLVNVFFYSCIAPLLVWLQNVALAGLLLKESPLILDGLYPNQRCSF